MKKFLLVVITLMPTLLSAQNGIVISNFSVSGGTITLDLSWNKVGMPILWLDSAWVFVDYNNAGVMKRLPLATGATLTATSAPGVGKVIAIPGNTQGVWVVGNARTAGSFSATVKLPFSGSNVSGACAYASNYPPLGKWNAELTELTITGTPPYLMKIESGTVTKTVQSGSPFLPPAGYTLLSFTDQTGAPGMLHCIPPTAPINITTSATTVCSGTPVTLTVSGGSEGSKSQFEWGAGTIGVGGTLTSSNTYSSIPTSTTTYWVRRVSTDGCGVTAAATVAVTVAPNNTYTLYSGSSITSATVSVAMTSIVYNTTGATGTTSSGLPSGVTAAYSTNQITISGTPSATGTFNYSATLTGGCDIVAASGKITVAAPPTPEGSGTQTWTCGTQTWSGALKKTIVGISATTNLGTTNPPASCLYRSSGIYSGSGYMYNWICVQNNATTKLCESPWRVPSRNDFVNLSKCYGGSGTDEINTTARDLLISSWGGVNGGYTQGTTFTGLGANSYYWSSDVQSSVNGSLLSFYDTGRIWPENYAVMSTGIQVRCVK